MTSYSSLSVQHRLQPFDQSAVDRLAAVGRGEKPPVVYSLTYVPVLPGSVAITGGDEIMRDDGGGRLISHVFDLRDDVGTVDYKAGFLYFDHDFFDGPPPDLEVAWDYDSGDS